MYTSYVAYIKTINTINIEIRYFDIKKFPRYNILSNKISRYFQNIEILPSTRVVGWGWWGATQWRGEHVLFSYTCIMDPLVPQKWLNNITARSYETLQPGSFCLTASRDDWIQTRHSQMMLGISQKAASGKADWWIAGHNTCTRGLLMYL